MASKRGIIAAINEQVGTDGYDTWRIGITHDPVGRKQHWGGKQNTKRWIVWLADSLADAQDIEAHFIALGMEGGTGGDVSSGAPIYVYIF